jgi:hypothetical protein
MTPPDPHNHYWRGFTLDHDEAEASAAFTARYGQPPAYIFESRGVLLVGPVPEDRAAQEPQP